MFVKICGIRSLKSAIGAIESKTSLIGLSFCSDDTHALTLSEALVLKEDLKDHWHKVIGVFDNTNFKQVATIAKELELSWVQVKAPQNRSDLKPLKNFNKLLVIFVNYDGSYEPIPYELESNEQFIYDGKNPGSGKSFDWEKFARVEKGPFLLAGGINVDNLQRAYDILKPNGFDLSSSVEKEKEKEKDLIKIKKFTTTYQSILRGRKK